MFLLFGIIMLSKVEQKLMLDKYLLILPQYRGDFEGEWKQCLGKLSDGIGDGYNLVKLNVFIDAPDFESFVGISTIILTI